MRNVKTRMRRPQATWIGALLVPAVMAGCGMTSPEPVPTAAVRWEPGPPTARLEDDPWVRAVRAGDLAWAAAVNSSNFTDPSMLNTWHEDRLHLLADRAAWRLDRGNAYVVLGPQPFAPLAVDVDKSGDAALVVGCADDLAVSPVADENSPEPWPQAYQFRLARGQDGNRRIASVAPLQDPYTLPSGELLTNEYCAGVEIPRGTFEPAPDPQDLADLRGTDLLAPPAPSPSFAVEVPK